jgi:DNA-binding LacI/PurR family transcriptional regulator
MQVIQRHGYVYNATAADFTKRKKSVIGLLIPTFNSTIHAQLIEGIRHTLGKNRYVLLIGDTNYDSEMERHILNGFMERNAAGVIAAGFMDENRGEPFNLAKNGIPCVVSWEAGNEPDINYVGIDNFTAAFEMTEYLISLGHRDLSLIVGPASKVLRAKKRLDGFLSAVKKAGLTVKTENIIECIPTAAEGKLAARRILDQKIRPTAIFAASDALAFGALSALHEARVKVPRHISIAGFDNSDTAEYCIPPLTTVQVPAYEMGVKAALLLLDLLSDSGTPIRHETLPHALIIRQSCGAPKQST